ncbi:MAG: transcriptional regulator [Planctomycetes bacterium]|nr:transcriptional regulator [Planctomycetota bacterium]
MNREELERLIVEVQQRQTELNDVEVKSARAGTPRRLYEALSAFANHTGGGVIVFGLDESADFGVIGVGNAHQLQADIGDLASSEMEPALRPEFTVEDIDGKTVVAVEVAEVPMEQRPCYYKTAGLQKGSYVRVGNTNRQMTDYEIFGYVSARSQPTFDEEPIAEATIEDLDEAAIDSYLNRLRQARPKADFLRGPREEAISHLGIVQDVDGTMRPTLAGLLTFGKYPQQFLPQLVITFLQFYGTTETEKTPRGERFLDNRKFEGSIPSMVTDTVNQVLASIRKSSLIEGLFRRDVPEYPEEAVREAILNAVAHRDYSPYVRGSYIQVRLFADRLEVQSPGGLYGNVSEENLEEESSTRNSVLMRLMEDLHLVENRGSGIRAMLEAMRRANLEPPRFEDKRSSFWVTFRNHTLMSPEAITWLNQFAGLPLNDRQRLALVYLRYNDQVTNSDYQRLNQVDALTAGRELRGLVQAELVGQESARRWTYYTLGVPRELPGSVPALSDEERILSFARDKGSIGNAECQALLGVDGKRAWYLLKKLAKSGLLAPAGEGKGRRYRPA